MGTIDLRQEIANWRTARQFSAISLVENTSPVFDSSDDYTIVYEAKFVAPDLEHMQLDIFLTAEGFVGTGIETYKRVFERLSAKTSKNRYAAGHEPGPIDIEKLFALLDAVSEGRLLLQVNRLHSRPTNIRAILLPRNRAVMPSFDEVHWRWLTVSNDVSDDLDEIVVRYCPW